MIKRIFAFLVLAITTLTAAAADVYISDFSIKAGETKTIAVNFDSERTDLKRLEGTITLPTGLTAMNQGTTTNYLWMTADATRTNGALAQYNTGTGAAAVLAFGTPFNAGTGAIAYIKVSASTDLADVSTITLSNFRATTTGNATVNLTSQNCTVTREAGTGTGDDPSQQTSDLAFSFSPATLTMTAGEVKQVEVQMANGMTATGLQADLVASTGLSIQSVTKSSRLSGWNYNPTLGRIVSFGAISGNEGTVFTVSLKADDDFSGAATLKLTNLATTDAGATSYQAEDVILPVTVQSQKNVALAFGSTQVNLNPGESTTVDVTLTSEVDLTGFMGTLTLPTGITATVGKGAIINSAPMYNTTTGMLAYLSGITAREGVLFTLTLTADDTFTADGTLTLTNISTTTASALSIVPADINLPVHLKTTATVTAPTAKTGLVYNGEAQDLINAGSAEGGEIQYSLDGTTYATAIPTGLNAGTYTVYYKVVADESHNDVAPASLNVTIAKAALTIATLAQTSLTYSGAEQTVTVSSVKAGELDVPATDYDVTGNKATDKGDYTATVTAKATSTNFTGEATAQWSIVAADAAAFTVTLDPTSFVYDGTAKQPAVIVKDGETVLTAGTDYTIAYSDNVNAGTATVTVTGQGNYTGEKTANFTIAKAQLTAVTLAQTTLTYNGTEQSVAVSSVKAENLDVTATDYTVSGNKATVVGTYTVTVTANEDGNFTGQVQAQFTIVPAGAEAKFTVELEYTTVEYDGTAKEPAVTVKDGSVVLTKDVDYTVAYQNNVNAGTATVVVTGMGNYSGTKTATFTITRTVFAIEAEDAENGADLAGVTVDVTILDESAKTLRIDNLNVPAGATGEDLAIYIPATLGGYEVTEIADGAITESNVTDIYLPDTEQPLTIGTGALPSTATIHTTLALLDDYALMTTLQQNYEATKVMTTVTPVNKFWTLGTGCDVILPATLNAYTVTTNSETQVSMIAISEADLTIGSERVMKGNNGVLLLGEAGQRYDLVAYSGRISSGTAIATTDNKDYGTDNLLEPVVEKMHYDADDSYFVMSNNEFHAIKAEGNEVKVPAGKAVLHLTSGQAGARAAVLGIVEETTGVNEVIGVKEVNDDSIFDLSGRKVNAAQKGIVIINGKKVVVR